MRSMRAFLMMKRGVFLDRNQHNNIVEDKVGECLAIVDLVSKVSSVEVALEEAVLWEW